MRTEGQLWSVYISMQIRACAYAPASTREDIEGERAEGARFYRAP